LTWLPGDQVCRTCRDLAAQDGRQGKSLYGAKVLVLGVAFKRDIDERANRPPSASLNAQLRGASVAYQTVCPRFHVAERFSPRTVVARIQTLSDELLDSMTRGDRHASRRRFATLCSVKL